MVIEEVGCIKCGAKGLHVCIPEVVSLLKKDFGFIFLVAIIVTIYYSVAVLGLYIGRNL